MYLGVLILPIRARISESIPDIRQVCRSNVQPADTLPHTCDRLTGRNHKWWKVVASRILLVYGQTMYLATPIGNFLITRYAPKSIYHSIWSRLTATRATLTSWGSPVMSPMAAAIMHRLQAHRNQQMAGGPFYRKRVASMKARQRKQKRAMKADSGRRGWQGAGAKRRLRQAKKASRNRMVPEIVIQRAWEVVEYLGLAGLLRLQAHERKDSFI